MKTKLRVMNSDGEIFDADDAGDLVHQLCEASLAGAKSDKEYMIGFAKRAKMVNDAIVPTDSVENFVQSLIEMGELKPVSEETEKEKPQSDKPKAKAK